MYIIPQPQELTAGNGYFRLTFLHTICLDQTTKPENYIHAKLLKEEIKTMCGLDLPIVSYMPPALRERGLKTMVREISARAGIILEIKQGENEESYSLNIEESGIRITGEGVKGLLYGIQTLRQIIRQEGAKIPYMKVKDYPKIANRGFYHDVTRGRVPKLTWLKRLADTMSFYKLNQLQLYIEHTYLFEGLSELWRDDTPLTAEEIIELDNYCADLGIELVPSLSTFGHLYKLLRTKTWKHLCEMPQPDKKPFGMRDRMAHHTINAAMEESYELVTSMIQEYMALFRSRQFNICADETFDLGKGATKKIADDRGVPRLYIDFVKKLCEFVVSTGRRPMFWGDIICGFPEFIKELPKETICLNWGYSADQSEEDSKALHDVGAVQYMCPGVSGWNQFINLFEKSYENITRMCSYADKYNAIGILNTDWGDYGHINHPSFSIPGLVYGAEFSWNKEKISFREMNKRISGIEYKDRSENIMSVVARLSEKAVFDWRRAVDYKEALTNGGEDPKQFLLNDTGVKEYINAVNLEIGKLEEELSECAVSMDSGCREDIQAFMIASEGMKIFNEIGYAVSEKIKERQKLTELAGRLETWFYHYRQLWRTVSKESEMHQISDIICWYADKLRETAGL